MSEFFCPPLNLDQPGGRWHSVVRTGLGHLGRLATSLCRRQRRARAHDTLLGLDSRLLEDIGTTRGEIQVLLEQKPEVGKAA